jgi:hypothetical protein
MGWLAALEEAGILVYFLRQGTDVVVWHYNVDLEENVCA